jgi:cold shock CspA family protein
VVTLRDAYAFVQSADSERQYFFHYSEIRGGGSSRDLRNGTELMFDIFDPRNGDKPTAINVTILPRGTIKMEVDIAVDLRGSIHKEPKERRDERGPDRRDKKDILLMTGRIKTSPGQTGLGGEPAPDSGVFGMEDTVNLEDGSPYKPRTEDEVLFDMVLVRATRQRRAVRVRLVKAKVDPRETGIVSALKESFGFIQCCDREERLFFHCSEMADRRGALREGDEVDFIVEKDRDGRNVGRAIRVLPAGSVSFEKVLGEEVAGSVERELRASKKGGRPGAPSLRDDVRGSGRELFGGLIACQLEGQQLRLPFEGEDVDLAGGSRGEEPPVLLKGDGVSVKVVLHKPSGRKRAAAVRVVKFGKEGREQGVVTRSKEGTGHGQIRCCDRQEPLPFVIADLDADPAAAAAAAAVGTEVEFNVVESRGDGRPMAVRLERLPPGTVSFETVSGGARMRALGRIACAAPSDPCDGQAALSSCPGGRSGGHPPHTYTPPHTSTTPTTPSFEVSPTHCNLSRSGNRRPVSRHGGQLRPLRRRGQPAAATGQEKGGAGGARGPDRHRRRACPGGDGRRGGGRRRLAGAGWRLGQPRGRRARGAAVRLGRSVGAGGGAAQGRRCVLRSRRRPPHQDPVSPCPARPAGGGPPPPPTRAALAHSRVSSLSRQPATAIRFGRRAARVALVAPAPAAGGEAEPASEVGPVQGVVVSVKGGGGFVRCCDRDARVHFAMADLDPASVPARPPRGGHPVAAGGAAEGEAAREEEAGRGGAGGHDEVGSEAGGWGVGCVWGCVD